MNFELFSPLVSAIFVFSLGFFVWKKGKKERVNITFALFSFVITIWMFGTFMMFLNKIDKNAIIFWDKFVYMGVVYVPVIMLDFGLALVKKRSRKGKTALIFGYILSTLFLMLIPTKYFVNDVFIYEWGAHTKAQFFHHVFLVYFAAYLISWFVIVFNYYKNTNSASERERMKYSFLAFFILAIIGSSGYLPAYGIGIYPFAYISGLIFTLILAYAIIVHRLMDIKIALRRSSVFLASLFVVLIMAAVVKYIFDNLFSVYSVWVHLLILVAALFIFPPVKNRFYRFANKYFFSSLYDSSEVIASLSDKLRSTLEAEKIYEYIFNILTNAFHIKAFGVLTHDKKNKLYVLRYNQGFKDGAPVNFSEDETLDKLFIRQNKTIIIEEIERSGLLEKNKTIDLLLKLKVEILAPLNLKDKTIGLIALGRKESGDMYNDEDLKVLEVIGAQAAIALENALLYKVTKNFSIKLQKEVERATRDLTKANEQLKKLDAAKSEFISIASHQLRTPLTVIKGYISMLLEGNFGVLTKPEIESLEKVYLSNERLISLVENLLDISRIESGQLEFNFKQVDLSKLVTSVVDKLSDDAKKKNLILEYKPLAKPLPKIKIDEEKIRKVIMNLIDNAIKYTKQGSIVITLELLNHSLKFCVTDSGLGIKSEDMVNMFKKFSRGTGISLIYTEGTGLGLYAARLTIKAHQGNIWVEPNGAGQGSKFCFELPIKA